jgi:hypothetical protein
MNKITSIDIADVVANWITEIIFFLVYGLIVMWLWNGVMTGVFDGVHTVSYLQAVCITAMCRILFKP